MPETLDSLERYLANGLIKGIGPATAKKIVDTFGKETINVFKLEPERLSQIKGISKDKALEIAQEFVENWELWQLVSYLEKFGLGPQSAQGIYKKLGENAIEKIEADPYVLVELSNKVDNLGKELKDFKKEVYQLFEKNTREIATVINQLSESISTKNHRNSEETKQRLEKNDKEHRIYEAQIAKLQLTTQYLEEKGKKLA